MLCAQHRNESANHYTEQSSGPESEATPTHVRSESSTSEDPVLSNKPCESSKPSESAGNPQKVHFVGEVCLLLVLLCCDFFCGAVVL
jgi:hypothetical protein